MDMTMESCRKFVEVLASDAPAILKFTRDVYYIGNMEIAKLEKGNVTFYNIDSEVIEKPLTEIKWDAESAEKGGYEHFMMKEIYEQPAAVRDTLSPRLKDGKIDAAFIVAGAPTTAITDLATASSVYLVSIDDEHMDTLLASSPYYARSIISADTYGTLDDVQTVAVAAVVLVRDDVSADAVYKFVSTIFENSGSIQHGKAEELSVEFGSSITAVPYHPGAAKYFAEKGIEVATK